jgi:hypothetical protein
MKNFITVLSIRERTVARSPYLLQITGGKFDIVKARKNGIPTRNMAFNSPQTNLCI